MEDRVAKFFAHIMEKMFEIAGRPMSFEEIIKLEEGWESRMKWKKEQEEEFKKYFKEYTKKNIRWSEKQSEFEFQMFNLDFGFKVEE